MAGSTSGRTLPGVIPIMVPTQRWVCPNCTETSVTHEAQPSMRFHSCAGLRGITAPFVPDGTRCKVVALDREDYLGSDLAQTDNDGRPVMSVVTVRDDGQDCVVLAPTVRMKVGRQ